MAQKEIYSAVVTANCLQTSKNGKDSVAIRVQTVQNLVTGEEIERAFIGYLYISPMAVERAVRTLREAFDYKLNSFVPLNDPKCLMGKECEITVEWEEYNGEMRPKVQWFNAPGSFISRQLKPVSPEEAAAIGASFDGYFQTAGNPSYSAPAKTKSYPRAVSVQEEDDLPF